ncbi:MAG: epimerase [Candidatus Hydrogenedentota bacterium]|nr:MAG: epimerase [Candidatus Hydrogenedentota bacterium]
MNIFITGGTGFLGECLIRLLTRDGQHTVNALARSERSADALTAMGATPVRADLTDGTALKNALADIPIDVVVHSAAEIASQRNMKKLRAANIDGTQNLYDAVRDRDTLQRFIFVSTVVTGEANGAVLDETSTFNVETEYGRTKQWAEKMLLDAFKENGFPANVIRPCHIYGNGGWYGEIIESVKKGKMRVPGNGKNWWDVVHVEDVASGIIAVLEHGTPGEIYHVCDGHPVTMGDFVGETARLAGAKKPGNVPRWIANTAIGKDTVTSVVRSAKTSNTKLKSLGWEPRFPDFETGLAHTFEERGATV